MPNSPLIVWLEDCHADLVPLVGGKCASLGELLRIPVVVPVGFAVTTEAHLLARKKGNIPTNVEEAIRDAYARLQIRCGLDNVPVAVRSSATSEDSELASFAGQLDTHLWVSGADAVIEHVVRCWTSLASPHVAEYGRHIGIDPTSVTMSVAVQEMVNARSAGVMFTINPLNGDRSKIVVESCWGLGEGIVTGLVSPDRFIVDKVVLEIVDTHIAKKTSLYLYDQEFGAVRAQPLSGLRMNNPSLSSDELIELATLGKTIERHYGQPQDIEWAIGQRSEIREDEKFFLLQSRPETVASTRKLPPVVPPQKTAFAQVVADMVSRVRKQVD